MNKKFLPWLTLCSLLGIFVLSVSAQGTAGTATAPAASGLPTQLGDIKASRVVGSVTVEDIGTSAQSALVDGQVIRQGSIVRTGDASSVVLLFSNGASISLAYNSELNIEQFLQNPFDGTFQPATATEEPSVSVTSIKLTRGELVGNVKKLRASGGSKFTVGTPVGAAGIRGTTFRIVYRPTGTGQAFNFVITTIEGNVEVQVASGTVAAPPVAVTQNQEIVINNIEVNAATNEVTVSTPSGATVNIAVAAPLVAEAPITTVQQVQAVAQNLARELLTVTFTTPTTPAPQNTGSGNTGGTAGGGAGNSEGSGGSSSNEAGAGEGSNNPNNPNNSNSSGNPNQNSNAPGSSSGPQNSNSPGSTTPVPRNTPGA